VGKGWVHLKGEIAWLYEKPLVRVGWVTSFVFKHQWT